MAAMHQFDAPGLAQADIGVRVGPRAPTFAMSKRLDVVDH